MRQSIVRIARLGEVLCFKARTFVCDAVTTIATVICDETQRFSKRVCDAFTTVAKTICDATQTVSETVCTATQTVTQTVCDATDRVTRTICDATDWIPFLGDLICTASHTVSSIVCVASHIVATTVCIATQVVSTVVCIASHLVSVTVCALSHVVSWIVCLASHILARTICIVWHIAIGILCTIVNGLIKLTLCWIGGLLRTVTAVFGGRLGRGPKVRHVFVLMLENRSFDHMLGFAGLNGPDAASGAATEADGLTRRLNPASGIMETVDTLTGTPRFNVDPADPGVPVYANTPADFKLSKDDKDPGHEFDNVLACLTGPGATYPDPVTGGYPQITSAGYIADYRGGGSAAPTKAMNCFDHQDPEQLPVLATLAREFAVCDRWFSSLPGPTWPNRFFVHAGTSGGLDDSPSGFDTATSTLVDGYAFEHGTIFDSLDWACMDWEIFEGDELPQVFAISGMNLNAARGKFTDFEDFSSRLNSGSYSPRYIFIEPNYGNVLPVLTDADFTCGTSQHPLDDVTRGERLIKQVYEAIRQSPIWNESMLIVTYDEHGGFYDHVTPPSTVSPGDAVSDPANVHHAFDFRQLGVRVPAVIVSPFIRKGTVDHTVYDHASVVATVERLFGLASMTDRDAAANDLLHLLSLATPRTDAPLTLPEPAVSGFQCDDD